MDRIGGRAIAVLNARIFRAHESGVALRFPPQSKTRRVVRSGVAEGRFSCVLRPTEANRIVCEGRLKFQVAKFQGENLPVGDSSKGQ